MAVLSLGGSSLFSFSFCTLVVTIVIYSEGLLSFFLIVIASDEDSRTEGELALYI